MKVFYALIILISFIITPWKEGVSAPLTINEAAVLQQGAKFPVVPLSDDALEALSLANKGRLAEARKKLKKVQAPYIDTLVIWLAATSSSDDVDFEDIETLFSLKPEWPLDNRIHAVQEASLPLLTTDHDIIKMFKGRTPLTMDALDKLIEALDRANNKEKATIVLRDFWTSRKLSPDEQKHFWRDYHGRLDAQSNIKRLQLLLSPNQYQYTNARFLAKKMKGQWPLYVETRIALQNPEKNLGVDGLLSSLRQRAPQLAADGYIALDRLYWHKEQERMANNLRAVEIIEAVKEWPSYMPNDRGWWRQQRIVVNRLIAEKEYEQAYKLASINPYDDGEAKADMDFVAGWLSLRYLKAPSTALLHFERMVDTVSTANSKSRAAYWLGLAYKEAGLSAEAGEWFGVAAGFPYSFYGHLASEEASCRSLKEPFKKFIDDKDYSRDPFTYFYDYLIQADMQSEAYAFLRLLSLSAVKETDYLWLSDYALSKGNQFHAMMIAKRAYNYGHYQIGRAAFPVLHYDVLDAIEPKLRPLIHSIVRQESGFNPKAISRAGALGLTQLMPFVAKKEARDLGVSYSRSKLLEDPSYSVSLGQSHIKHLLDLNKGHHIMRVLAGYNAGVSRVKEWLAIYGDPGSKEINAVDWMESLPFPETRDYVRKVLENYIVYSRMFSNKAMDLPRFTSCR